ncbi:MAG: FAD-dependent monooxygenase, partial [Pseudomonadota bacterium]
MLIETDILVAGAGPAGLAAACVFGAAGHRVTLVDPAAPITGEDDPGADLRTTALLQPARDLLGQAGVWDRLAPHAAELWTMRIIDAAQTPPVSRDFQARDISDAPFGWNFPNWLLRREMLATLNDLSTVTPRFGTGVTGLLCRDTEARVTLSDGTRIAAQLVVACDGKASPLRALAG